MWLLRERLSDFEKNDVQNSPRVKQILLQPYMCTQITYCGQLLLFFDKCQICSASCQLFEWTLIVTLQHSKEFNKKNKHLFDGFILMCNLKKRLIYAAFWVLLQVMFMNRWKQTAQRLKSRETTNNQEKIWWNIYRDNNFHSRR